MIRINTECDECGTWFVAVEDETVCADCVAYAYLEYRNEQRMMGENK
jgi:hypothetical protein